LGVGLGNWKLRVLEYENPEKSDFIYQYKAHNDFIEITSEVGIFGGLLFVSIFLFILGYFAVVLFRKKGEDAEKLFFLPAFGIIAYSVDAFFNFPQDRPEIQSLFALYVGIAVGLALIFFEKESFLAKSLKGILGKIMQIIALLMMLSLSIGSVYVLYQNFQSLKVQLVINQEINEGNLRSSSKGLMKLFPKIPNLNAFAEPIAVQKARYLIKEGKHKEAQNLLRQDKSNPFDGRREFFLTKSFYAQKQYDSAVYYAEKCYKLKPLFYKNSTYLASSYELSGRFDKAEDFWRNYLKTNKKNPKPWLFLARIVNYQKGTEETKKVLNQALRYHRGNKELLDLKASLKVIFNLKPALAMATSLDAYGKGNGANVGTYSSHNGLNQKWKLISLGKGIYKIVSMRAPNKVLDVAGGRYKKWTNIRLWEDNNGENQKWKIEQLIGEYYRIYPMKAPQFSLSVVGGNKKMANVALMPTSKTSKAQMWRFGEVKK
ncbi:MAG: RICIN domain-containing protein, partial [Flavobacteriaceae bacterium]|nr:RICIN domain-containing protein [Flavobacteriaceae bacterium]